MSGSLVEVKAHDDAVNAGIDDGTKPGDIIMNGGLLYAISEMDAIDSNGEIQLNDGLVFSISNGKGSRAFDCDYNEFYVGPKAKVIGLSEAVSPFTGRILKHPSCEVRLPNKNLNDNTYTYRITK